jgi:hypothetical protein
MSYRFHSKMIGWGQRVGRRLGIGGDGISGHYQLIIWIDRGLRRRDHKWIRGDGSCGATVVKYS